ncbi:PLP-dependent aminotransferase family protein [Cupriavidus sp. AcVe19-1a]|uniref:MocR-like pyridoxine biosynthesis transcription factor PdxR n=1 Tax=Cupriavidus sp. AcVe19-1a TaxID=2821359 RepID=UPI001AE82B99|nr:PLP-dependent aminotransferase family protein [Cupriavidus sp. AcVe19-1a]MBP0633155.1 PLP-dependent aminotransferase family protein [Cupriavidus sp. AcVe19-1a]
MTSMLDTTAWCSELDRTSTTPLYQQLCDSIRTSILAGRIEPGVRLPSTRDLADELKVSRNTVVVAYDQLQAEGFLSALVGHGTVVSRQLFNRIQSVPPAGQTATSARLSARAGQMLQLAPRAATPGGTATLPRVDTPFRVGVPALDEFPMRTWGRIVSRRSHRLSAETLDYKGAAGYPPLRRAIASYLGVSRGIVCDPDDVLIVAGAQGGISLAAQVLLDPGDVAWVEDPGYRNALGALLGAGARPQAVPVDHEGLDVATGLRLAPGARLACVTPSHQYPLGITMSLSRRLDLLAWARSAGAWIIEDDYDSEFHYAGHTLRALRGLDSGAAQVVYVGSFSKIMFPGLRLGYLVVPGGHAPAFRAALRFNQLQVPLLEQAATADFILEGHLARHIGRMRTIYAARQTALVAALRRHGVVAADFVVPGGGMHLVLPLARDSDDVVIAAQAAQLGLGVQALSQHAHGHGDRRGLLIGFANTRPEQMEPGVARLATLLDSAKRRSVPAGSAAVA